MASQIYTAQVLGLTAAAFHTGLQWSMSYITMPAILAAKDVKEKVALWKTLWTNGARTGPPAALVSVGIMAYVAYFANSPSTRRLYTIAAIMPALTLPFTKLFLDSTNAFLLEKNTSFINDEETKSEDIGPIIDALNRWKDFNYIRTLMPLAATIIAIRGLTSNNTVGF